MSNKQYVLTSYQIQSSSDRYSTKNEQPLLSEIKGALLERKLISRSEERSVYLLYCFADDLLVLLLSDFLLLVIRFDGVLHFIHSSLLDLLFLKRMTG